MLFWIGALTYPVYLIHSSIFAAIQAGLPQATLETKWVVGTVFVVIGAWLLHMTVEEAVLNYRARAHRDVTSPYRQPRCSNRSPV